MGAPKNLDEEYRYNIPVLTYGFDRSFRDFFGYPGVLAINAAMRVLNELPAATDIDTTVFPPDTRRIHRAAQGEGLVDLQTMALALVVEQLGLANPVRYTWALRGRTVHSTPAQTNYLVIQRNFDPETLMPSFNVNGKRNTYEVFEFQSPPFADAIESSVDPTDPSSPVTRILQLSLVASDFGIRYDSLTRDDVGGIRYLLSPTNINAERLPPDVEPADGTSIIVMEALRPGVNKIHFEEITNEWAPPIAWSKEIQFTDRYYDGQMQLREQRVKRVIRQPDIIFSAADLGTLSEGVYPIMFDRTPPRFKRTNWLGFPLSPAGPGTIEPGVSITFAKLGDDRFNTFPGATEEEHRNSLNRRPPRWGWFSLSLSNLVIFPVRKDDGVPSKVNLIPTDEGLVLTTSSFPAPYLLQSSADLTNWTTISNVWGGGSLTVPVSQTSPTRFYRLLSMPE